MIHIQVLVLTISLLKLYTIVTQIFTDTDGVRVVCLTFFEIMDKAIVNARSVTSLSETSQTSTDDYIQNKLFL